MASSGTSSRTSERSSTSDGSGPPRTPLGRLLGIARLVHPFPSVLDGIVVAGVAAVAGGDPATCLRLGLSMTALQASIGAVNDLVDIPGDAGRPHKPLANGVLGRRSAEATAVVAAAIGIALAALSGPSLVILAGVVLAIGYGYDTVAKGTAWSWVPFAIGIPLLPVYGWLGASGSLPLWFAGLLPMAAMAGTALAVANARVDLEGDIAMGTSTVATALGSRGSLVVGVVAWVVVGVVGIGWLVAIGAPPLPIAGVGAGLAVIAAGLLIAGRPAVRRRALAWELQGIGAGIAAVAWLVGVS